MNVLSSLMRYVEAKIFPILILFIFIANSSCQSKEVKISSLTYPSYQDEKLFQGMTLVAPRDSAMHSSLKQLKALGVNSIAVVPYAFSRLGEPRVFYNQSEYQWWGERPQGVEYTIRQAKKNGFKVFLKPQVYIPGSWTGALSFELDSEYNLWEKEYEEYILSMAKIAERYQVELFCIGTEFKAHSIKRASFWQSLIKKLREVYSGPLTYAANWDEYEQISFWEALDYIGVDAYFPLLDQKKMDTHKLAGEWKRYKSSLQAISEKFDRPILFTEYGYMSLSECTHNAWEKEANRRVAVADYACQAQAIEVLFDTFWESDWWMGGFYWKWYLDPSTHESRPETDYSPQGKPSELVFKKWFESKS